MLLQVAAGERSASLVYICLGMLAFVALSDIFATLYTLSFASTGVAWSVPGLALFQRGGSAGGGALWRRAGAAGVCICSFVLVKQVNWEPIAACACTEALCHGAAGVSICTFVLVKQVNWDPPAACASTEALCYGVAGGGPRRLVDTKAVVRL